MKQISTLPVTSMCVTCIKKGDFVFCAESSEGSMSGLNRQLATNVETPSSKRNDVDMEATPEGNIYALWVGC